MASLGRCSSCRGFLPPNLGSCPNCGASEPAADLGSRIGSWIKAAGGASVAMTLMACYGVPVGPDDTTDTDPTEGTGGTGDTEPASSSSGGGAESTGAASSSGGAESTGAGSTGGSESGGSDGSTGAGGVDERPLPR